MDGFIRERSHSDLSDKKPPDPKQCCGTNPTMYYQDHWKIIQCPSCGRKNKSMAWDVATIEWNKHGKS